MCGHVQEQRQQWSDSMEVRSRTITVEHTTPHLWYVYVIMLIDSVGQEFGKDTEISCLLSIMTITWASKKAGDGLITGPWEHPKPHSLPGLTADIPIGQDLSRGCHLPQLLRSSLNTATQTCFLPAWRLFRNEQGRSVCVFTSWPWKLQYYFCCILLVNSVIKVYTGSRGGDIDPPFVDKKVKEFVDIHHLLCF